MPSRTLRHCLLIALCMGSFAHASGVARKAAAPQGKAPVERAAGSAFRDCAACPEMVVVPAGEFLMGGDAHPAEKPAHAVAIAAPFAIARTEVTQKQWRAIIGRNPSVFAACGDACPAENITWDDAQAFVRALSARTGQRYRLPSEAEWEYACRAGGSGDYCGESLDASGWYGAYGEPAGNSGKSPNPVATRAPNAWGLNDMNGNVWEWTADCWNPNYEGAPADGSAWTSGQCAAGRVFRGGAWDGLRKNNRAASRQGADTAYRNYNLGVRPVRELP